MGQNHVRQVDIVDCRCKIIDIANLRHCPCVHVHILLFVLGCVRRFSYDLIGGVLKVISSWCDCSGMDVIIRDIPGKHK